MRLALVALFVAIYFVLQRVVLFVPHQFAATRVDDFIEFDARWTWVYLSVAGLLGCAVAGWGPRNRATPQLRNLFVIVVICFAAFFLFPVEGPRPDVMEHDFLYNLVVRYDRNLNTFPSLHAALVVYAVLFARRVVSKRIMILLALWVAFALFASLAIKQHYAVDVLAGIVVAIGADRFS
jgi:membrane-associated phospholipid phosphatase